MIVWLIERFSVNVLMNRCYSKNNPIEIYNSLLHGSTRTGGALFFEEPRFGLKYVDMEMMYMTISQVSIR